MKQLGTLGDYTIIKLIGQGSLGSVYLGEHRFMKRPFVLKVLPEELATDRGFIQRFEEEVSLLTALSHPNIVRTHNVSQASGRYFLVTDCVVDSIGETTNLAQYVGNHSHHLREEEVLRILRQVAAALDYGRSLRNPDGSGIAHLNLKPNNILIANDPSGFKIVLSDFGLSRIIGIGAILTRTYQILADSLQINGAGSEGRSEGFTGGMEDSNRTDRFHTSFLQTYAFLAPEQHTLMGAKKAGPAADSYAFGVLAYFLLTRELPEGIFEMPSKKCSGLKYNWDVLLWNCLQKDPSKRPAELTEMIEKSIQERGTRPFSHASGKQPKPKESIPPIVGVTSTPSSQRYTTPPPPRAVPIDRAPAPQQPTFFTGYPPASAMPSPQTPKSSSVGGVAVKAVTSASEALFRTVSTSSGSGLTAAISPESGGVATAMGVPVSTTTLSSTPAIPTIAAETSMVEEAPKPVVRARGISRPTYDPDPGATIQADTSVTAYHPKPVEVADVEPILTDMIVIQGSSFARGSSDGNRDEMPRHSILLNSYAIDKHPVTNEQFIRFLEFMGGEKDANNYDIILLKESRIKRAGGRLSIESGYGKHPTVGVTWYGAVAYAKWLGKRLPTEAEWEVASCGGMDGTVYPTGDDVGKSKSNFFSSDTTLVMSYPANGYGLFDMAGLVYEWCQDWYGYNYYEESAQEPEQPKGPIQGVYRVLRGGCWKSLIEDLRCAHRHRNNPGTSNRTYGFRCAADVE